jgi:hypothetical protein
MLFLKEAQANKSVFQEYGWKNTGTLFKSHLLVYLIESLKEVVDEDIDEDGVILRKYYGIQRIPDIMALKEMEAYKEGLNVDRLISLSALIAFVKIRESNGKRTVRVENDQGNKLEKSPENYKLSSSPFRNLGKGVSNSQYSRTRTPFKSSRR